MALEFVWEAGRNDPQGGRGRGAKREERIG